LIFGVYSYSQCISGDCTNGEGKFRFTNPIVSTYMGKFNDAFQMEKVKSSTPIGAFLLKDFL